MEHSTFKVKKSGKYIEVIYVPPINIKNYSLLFNIGNYCSSKEDAITLMTTIKGFEMLFDEKIREQGLPYQIPFIILHYMKSIDSIASGVDIRSKVDRETIADSFLHSYKMRYEEAIAHIEGAQENMQKEGESYLKNARFYDKANELNTYFNLGYPEIKVESFKVDELDNLIKASNNLLEKLIEENNQRTYGKHNRE